MYLVCTIFDEVTPTLLKETREVIEQISTDFAMIFGCSSDKGWRIANSHAAAKHASQIIMQHTGRPFDLP